MKKKIFFIIGTIIILLFLFFGPMGFLGSIFYNRQDVEFIAEKINMPILCAIVPPSDHCEEGFPCAKPDKCYYDVAVHSKNSKACDYINRNEVIGIPQPDGGLRAVTWTDCYFDSDADLRRVYMKCEQISVSSQGQCYGFFASKLNDSSLCKINDKEQSARCYLEFVASVKNSDVSMCEEEVIINGPANNVFRWRDSCYYSIAVNRKDINFCQKINDQKTRGYCEFDVEHKK